ncbi:hypothetical protein DICPUDRAFT_77221 [Dictyostelium purpureum]|uniref:CCHC-type domain-containing protein n=1 Tax=Dictyostelium purpureum TaxID=5786 RepID=F0ZFZ0_DICPU|nr:uncharacterized protein DICPUDRAFT_77221 [Dictyostelium purpureum]EGC37123.1 hypothetical protein DICPUDRAFT_77221 [Dictyostelium purpureum]|eukprot:XP_003286326.1 hypothetical protein DICPUDRAFT_77221 [Dictyostelium purpureum]
MEISPPITNSDDRANEFDDLVNLQQKQPFKRRNSISDSDMDNATTVVKEDEINKEQDKGHELKKLKTSEDNETNSSAFSPVQIFQNNIEYKKRVEELEKRVIDLEKQLKNSKTCFKGEIEPIFSINLNCIEESKIEYLENFLLNFFKSDFCRRPYESSQENGEIEREYRPHIVNYYYDGFVLDRAGNDRFSDMASSIPYNFTKIPNYFIDKGDIRSNKCLEVEEEKKPSFSGYCFNCLQQGHPVYQCPYTYNHKMVQKNKKEFNELKALQNGRYFETLEGNNNNNNNNSSSDVNNNNETTTSTSIIKEKIESTEEVNTSLNESLEKDESIQKTVNKKAIFVQNTSSTPNKDIEENEKFKENNDYIEFPKDLFHQPENIESEESYYKTYDKDFFKNFINNKSNENDSFNNNTNSNYNNNNNNNNLINNKPTEKDGYNNNYNNNMIYNQNYNYHYSNYNNQYRYNGSYNYNYNYNYNQQQHFQPPPPPPGYHQQQHQHFNEERFRNNDRYRDFYNDNSLEPPGTQRFNKVVAPPAPPKNTAFSNNIIPPPPPPKNNDNNSLNVAPPPPPKNISISKSDNINNNNIEEVSDMDIEDGEC